MFKKIVMEVIPHAQQRYDTVGDYSETEDGTWHFVVSDLGDWRFNFSVLLHEFIEFAVMHHTGVKEADVLAFDLAMPNDSPYADDPGFDPKAPYHREHVLADTCERILAMHLGFEFEDYDKACLSLPDWKGLQKASDGI
jgi:hypothetical protein